MTLTFYHDVIALSCCYTEANIVTREENGRNLKFALQIRENDMIDQGKIDTL